ncbi:hypothetical protein OC846_003528 [Tilletia horrida]|uniref:DUF7918 domain-containing protein n=1 Tax=Tilletia horrida TaxID=155126 RepID=A0AAN6GPI6_9BASI|nr:hypothetical protein OC846_003528 [Tilletia horrida]KAK0565909.1 hypothetical protein OC861_003497 [Tilletia horrida]
MSESDDDRSSPVTEGPTYALALKNFSCQLLDPDRKPRQLYDVRVVGPNRIEAYVEARLDERFMVRLTGQNPKQSYDARLLIGGNDVQGMALHEDPWHADFMGRPEGKGVVRPYTFAQLQVSDDSAAVRDPRKLAELGVVEVCLKRIASLTPYNFKLDTDDPFKDGKVVHEKAKRLGGVQFALGDTRRSKTPARSFYVRHDNKAEPVRFVFKCMTKFGLELQSIIPSSFPVRKRQPSELEDNPVPISPTVRTSKRQRLHAASDVDVKVEVKEEVVPDDGLGTVEAPVELEDSDGEQDEQGETRRGSDDTEHDAGDEEVAVEGPQAEVEICPVPELTVP